MGNKRTLDKELHLAGAKRSETGGLIDIASQLQQLKPVKQTWWRRWRLATLGTAAIVGVLLGGSLVAYSQTSSPGSWLYPSKRLSEKVAVAVDPSYRATLMMRRSQEVKVLVEQRASRQVVLATLADYRTAASAYKSSNYAAFEYCKNNLKRAAQIAPTAERSAITSTLSSLNV